MNYLSASMWTPQETVGQSRFACASAAIERITVHLGIAPKALRRCWHITQVDTADRPGCTRCEPAAFLHQATQAAPPRNAPVPEKALR
ncbi:MAG TPA: hypothetical protein PKE32_04590, partial [Miltoncostaeaceae bacterium]|nr:hypothetical protein [Miltoncostaeaceae bacterium]